MKYTRLKYLDCIKGFAILLVILGHVIQFSDTDFDDNILFRYIYSFHMPLFMFISGFSILQSFVLNDNTPTLTLKNGLTQIKKRFKQLIVPFFVWFVIGEFLH